MLDPGKRIATLAGEPLTLKPKEFALLNLMRNAGRVLPRKLIEEKLYTWDQRSPVMPLKCMCIIFTTQTR